MTALGRPSAAAGRRRGGLIVRLVALAAVLLLAWTAVIAAQVWWTARADDRTPVDAIVVLGASQYDGTPTPIFAARLAWAARLHEQGVAPVVVTTGSKLPGDRFTEAESGKAFLQDEGLAPDEIVAVPVGNDTWQSLRAVAKQAKREGWESIVIVSDPWHEFRAREMAESLGLTATTSPTRTGPAVQTRATQARAIVRETAAYAWWRVTGGAPWSGPDLY